MKRQRMLIRASVLGLLLALIAGFGPLFAGPRDFDDDGYADLAIGVPYENVGSTTDAGSVSVVYGTSAGLSGTSDEYWQQNYLDGSDAETYEYFGRALTVGDFDGDGYFDLAVGVPYEDVGSVSQAGAVNVIYGTSVGGLDVAGNQYWNQDESGVAGAAEESDHFGSALAAGDFDGDGYDDLAVGIPSEDLGAITNTGAVEIYYGSASGLITRVSNDFWHQDRSGVADTADAYDLFGSALTVGDFDGDDYADLAVGVPYEDVGSPAVLNAGAVNVLYGSSTGIVGSGSDYWHQDSSGIGSLTEENDRFGFALTAGDFDDDGYADLAVGVPYEHWNDPDTGIVQVIYGSADGLSSVGDQLWRQDVTDIEGGEEADDRFGYALAAGNFDGDEYADLAIGVPYEAIGTTDQAGAVNVLYGSDLGLTADGDQLWYQGNNGLWGTAETGDRFGYALAAIPTVEQPKVYLPMVLTDYE